MTSPNRLTDLFVGQDRINEEARYGVSAVLQGHDGSQASVTIDSFDGGQHVFGPIPYILTPPLPDGTAVLVQADENDSLWIVAP